VTPTPTRITVACLDMAGTTVADDGSVIAAFSAAVEQFGLPEGTQGYDDALAYVRETMGQSKIEVFRHILGAEDAAQQANAAFEEHYARSVRGGDVEPLPGATETFAALRAAGIKVCLATGFSPVTRDALLDALGWRPLIDDLVQSRQLRCLTQVPMRTERGYYIVEPPARRDDQVVADFHRWLIEERANAAQFAAV
jgi:phosphonatase-like hydrolase